VDRARAGLKAGFLARFEAGVIRLEFPHLAERMFLHATAPDGRSRSLEPVEGLPRRLALVWLKALHFH
jgi:hypothetical protein